MSFSSLLNTLSTFFFASGFIFSKCVYLPPVLLGASFRILELVSYLFAYTFWIMRTYVDPAVEPHHDQWYGFMQSQEQIRLGAYINAAATLLSFGVFFIPMIILPASWLFLVGNMVWAIGEYHRLHNPLADPDNTFLQQQAFVKYAILICVISLISAISTTACLFLPALITPIFICSVLLSTGVAGFALRFWLESFISSAEKDQPKNSYKAMDPLLETSTPVEKPLLEPANIPLFTPPPRGKHFVNEEPHNASLAISSP